MPRIKTGWKSDQSPPKPIIPQEIQDDLDVFRSEIRKAHMYWSHFKALFTESQQTVEILNESAGSFFSHIHEIYFDYVILHVGRMLDPIQTGKHKNFTLQKLHNDLQSCLGQVHYNQAAQILSTVKQQYDNSFKHWRNWTIAHTDYDTTQNPERLPEINVLMVDQLLEKLAEYMNVVYGYVHHVELADSGLLVEQHGVESLLSTLRMGLRYEELVQSRAIAFDDLEQSKWQLRKDD